MTASYTKPGSNPLQDPSANAVAAFSSQVVTNDTPDPPTVSSASVDGTTLTVTFSRNLNTGSAPDGSAFSVSATPSAGAARTIPGTGTVALANNTATVTLASAVAQGETVTASYAKPTANPLQDPSGNEVAAFSGQDVTNDTPDPAPGTPPPPVTPDPVTPDPNTPPPPPTDTTPPSSSDEPAVRRATITIFFDELLAPERVPPVEAFEVVVGGADAVHPTAVGIAGREVRLTLAAPVNQGETVAVVYTPPDGVGERLQDRAGNAVAALRLTAATGLIGRPAADAGADVTVDPGAAAELDGSASADPDGQVLIWSWSQVLGDAVTLDGADTATLSFTAPASPGALVFRLTVTDPDGLTGFDEVTVTVRDPAPSFGTARVAALSLRAGRAMEPVVLPQAAGGNGALRYRLTSEPAGLAGLSFDAAERTLSGTPEGVGRWEFTLRADDADGNRADADAAVLTFAVAVEDARSADARTGAVKRTLAAAGRRTLAGALDAIGARLAGAPENSITVAGHAVPLGVSGAALSRSFSAQELLRSSAFSWRLDAAPGGPAGWDAQGPEQQRDRLAAEAEAPAAVADAGAVAWSVWGAGDFGTFAGRPEPGTRYEGEQRTGWLGVDAGAGAWVAGLAASHGAIEADYGFDGGAGQGGLETTLTALYPYGRLDLPLGLELRGVAGAGRGEVRHVTAGRASETSDVTMWMASLGIGVSAPFIAGVDLEARADGGFVRMETGEGPDVVDGLSTDGWRVRAVLEASRRFALGEGKELTPFVEALGRHDWGEDLTGFGLEVAGGLRYTAPRVQVAARGRWLAAHSGEGVSEVGVSVTARVASRAQGRGLSLSLSPSWGVPSSGVDRLWSAHGARGLGSTGTLEPDQRLDAEVGYGLPMFGGGFTGTPYAGLRLSGGEREWRAGWRLAPAGAAADFSLGLEGTRREGANDDATGSGPEHTVGVRLEARY